MEDSEQIKRWEDRIKASAWVGFGSAALTAVASIVSIFVEPLRSIGMDPWSLVDAALMAAVSYGTLRKNYLAAFGQVALALLTRIILLIEGTRSIGVVIGGFVFIALYLIGAISAYNLHRYNREKRAEAGIPEERKSVGFYILSVFGSLFILGFLFLVWVGVVGPEIEVVSGNMLKSKYLDFVKEKNLIGKNEKIIYWYSDAFIDFKESFSFFTDKKLVIYQAELAENPAIVVPYSKIEDMELDLDSSRVFVYLKNEESEVYFPVPSSEDEARKFYDGLEKEWKKR
ncbi:hypothetical protein CH371_15480 [Leptospira wolffii]|uniref:Uncharacterized protein n=1 Tax=Leptospira wolffii TaxID=409998 RepID=A0A2M9Z936_9LEPT|nr:PH domain-containing protein [Leptospira wolffii]PJZ64904.1 hypothetical protein CH371_15480 [Leptospira wolffii]